VIGTTLGQWVLICFVFLVLQFIGTVVCRLTEFNNWNDSFWTCYTLLIDIGTQTGLPADATPTDKLVSVVISLVGFVYCLTLLGMVVDLIREVLDDCRTRFSSVPAKDHWLILGWGDKTLLLVDELLSAISDDKRRCCGCCRRRQIVILADLSEQHMAEEVQMHCKTGQSRHSLARFFFPVIRYKEGNPTDVTELLKVSAPYASEILVASTSTAFVVLLDLSCGTPGYGSSLAARSNEAIVATDKSMTFRSKRSAWLLSMLCIFSKVGWSYKLSSEQLNKTVLDGVNASDLLENVSEFVGDTLVADMEELDSLPDKKEKGPGKGEKGGRGMGELGRTMEFLMLKVAQLETLAELQHQRIEKLEKKIDPDGEGVSMAQKSSEESAQAAHDVLKRVVEKHAHQREHREYHPAQMPNPKGTEEAEEVEEGPGEEGLAQSPGQRRALLQKREKTAIFFGRRRRRFIPEIPVPDIRGLVEDAVANLLAAGDGFDADCPDPSPDIGVDGAELFVDFGHWKCTVTIMNHEIELYDFDLGRKDVNVREIVSHVPPLDAVVTLGEELVDCDGSGALDYIKCLGYQIVSHIPPLNAVVTLGEELVNCQGGSGALDIIKCFGFRILELVPPLNFLSRLGEIFGDFIGTFAEIAKTVVRNALDKGLGMVQTAAKSAFPEIGAQPAVHYAGKNLVIKTHSQSAHQGTDQEPKRMSTLQTGGNASRMSRAGGDDDDSVGAITFEIGPYGPETTGLITQFAGKETHTGSCLAFAPRTKTGNGNQATKQDWQVDSNDKFLQLEPWAVPCDNAWMQQNWDKWQGYTFYTTRSNIEKCVTVTFELGLQPVAAFVGGLQFDVLPTPFFEVDIQICWPKGHPGGVDLSALHFEFRSVGILLLSRTLRLTKRFGDNTDFLPNNLNHGEATIRSQLGLPRPPGSDSESTSAIKSMSRIKSMSSEMLQTNSSHDDKAEEEVVMQWADAEELYLASVEYGPNMSVNTTSELRGPAAHRLLSAMQTQQSKESHQLFQFKSGGMVSFDLEGLLTTSNDLELGVKMGFGPFSSPRVRIPLLNIVDQFEGVLRSLPFVTPSSIASAVRALSDFSQQGIDGKVQMATVIVQHGLRCGYFYDKTQCQVPDLSDWTPAHEVVVPKIYMEHGNFPEVRQGDQFCMRCTGQLVTKKEGNYKFFLSSDDGSLMWLNGEKVVDNDGCHGEIELGSSEKFLLPGAHDLTVHMCERGGGENLKMRYQGPDTNNSKITVPEQALQHVLESNCLPLHTSHSDALALTYCPELKVNGVDLGSVAKACNSADTGKVQKALANKMFTTCGDWCIYDFDQPEKVSYRWHPAGSCWAASAACNGNRYSKIQADAVARKHKICVA
ncbi:unnamed protein product, partial [Symbiodinium microadriaticum]